MSNRYALLLAAVVSLSISCSEPAPYPRNQSFYVEMRDGVRIAIDVWLPDGATAQSRLPTIMRATRYWRARDVQDGTWQDDRNFAEAEKFNGAGFALVLVDARGSGASFGFRPFELAEEEVRDYDEIADWIVDQPWSNQRVGAYGVSYAGNTTEMLAVNRNPAVKALAPLFNDFDNFGHLVFPGGLLTIGFLQGWSDSVGRMDRNDICALSDVTGQQCTALKERSLGVKAVDSDRDRSLLAAAVAEHVKNTVPYDAALEYEFRDDPFGQGGPNVGYRRSPAGHLAEIEASQVPMFVRAGWLDAATVNGTLGRFATISNSQQVYIGPWDHGARNDADPFRPADTPVSPTRDEQDRELLNFFDNLLKEEGKGVLKHSLSYYTMGAGTWTETDKWPPDGFESQDWFFGAQGTLNRIRSMSRRGSDSYRVDFAATTGRTNRWFTNGGAGDVVYPDRAEEDKKLLTYTSAPMEQDMEITGHPLVTLFLTSTESDGALIVYLEDVAPDGRVTYITEGQLRAVMRKTTEEEPLYKKFGPHRSERRDDASPLVPGEMAELTFDLWATSVLIKQGHRIRVAITGADKDSFLRYPRDGSVPVLTIQRNAVIGSKIVLPMRAR